MTQNERWQKYYEGVKTFIESNHWNLSKYDLTERRLYTWLKHNKIGFVSPEGRYEARRAVVLPQSVQNYYGERYRIIKVPNFRKACH